MIKSAGALFYCSSTKRYLFLLRDNHPRYENTWCFPGGKMKKGESEFDGALRELREELGINVDAKGSFSTLLGRSIPYIKTIPIEKFTSEDGKFEYHTYVFVVENEFMPILNHEYKGYCWTKLRGWPKPLHPGVFSTLNEKSIRKKLLSIEQEF